MNPVGQQSNDSKHMSVSGEEKVAGKYWSFIVHVNTKNKRMKETNKLVFAGFASKVLTWHTLTCVDN